MDKRFLRQLGLRKHNAGTSTGLESTNSGKYIRSVSPVDGEWIGSVSKTSAEEYAYRHICNHLPFNSSEEQLF